MHSLKKKKKKTGYNTRSLPNNYITISNAKIKVLVIQILNNDTLWMTSSVWGNISGALSEKLDLLFSKMT